MALAQTEFEDIRAISTLDFLRSSHHRNMDVLDQEKAKALADAERDLARLWRAWRTIHQMCADRVRPPCSPICKSHS